MPNDKWYSLENKNKEISDQLDDKAKAIILGYGNTNSSNSIPKPNNALYSQPLNQFQRRQANLHDLSANNFLQAFMHQTDMTKSDENHEYSNPDEFPPYTNKLRITTLCLLMQLSSEASTRFVNKVEYCGSIDYTTNCGMSLVDRSENGGVSGNDVRVIFKTNRTVKFCVNDEHQVTNIPIGTVVGAVNFQKDSILKSTFLDKGHHSKSVTPTGYKKIRFHLVFDAKHDRWHKAMLTLPKRHVVRFALMLTRLKRHVI
jgi:hypothetical protein